VAAVNEPSTVSEARATARSSSALAGPHPFGSHSFPYPASSIRPSGDPSELDRATASFYDRWKAALVKPGCGGYYVLTRGGTGASRGAFTVSEGHGYGMLITAMMAGHDPDAQSVFDGMYRVFRNTPSIHNADLMGWEILRDAKGQCTTETGNPDDQDDSATDGDLDIAFGLLVAHAQWGSGGAVDYLGEARKVIAAILVHEVNPDTHLLMLGDWADIKAPYHDMKDDGGRGRRLYYGTRPSDFMMGHMRAFGRATSSEPWSASVDAHYALVDFIQGKFAPVTGLIPDFIESTDTTPIPAKRGFLEGPEDGMYWENACRVPWRIGTDYVVSSEPRAKEALQKINRWIRETTHGDPRKIRNGYTLSGVPKRNKPELHFVAPFGVAAMVDGSNQAWLDAIWQFLVRDRSVDYYGASIKLIGMLVMSGNWFQPEIEPVAAQRP
jgi:endo-1,4-beta-D-glucanase Y